jgi:8-oxo-dGTP pyrophosphatase MutT (NUDIX family)
MIPFAFDELTKSLKARFKTGLPGVEAQLRMAPDQRKPASEYLDSETSYRVGCVLALLYPDVLTGEARMVLMLRTSDDGVHAGQISFPGGKQEPDDKSLAHTALRETEEELGVTSGSVELIGPLTSLYIPPSKFLVHPFLGITSREPAFSPSDREVSKVLTPAFDFFTNPQNIKRGDFSSSRGYVVNAPFYALDEYKIWGATAMMISEITAMI